jgi:hypothetical protein
MTLICSDVIRIAHYATNKPNSQEHHTVTLSRAVMDCYWLDPSVVNAAEIPPTASADDSRRRVDNVTLYVPYGPVTWRFKVAIVWECKRPDATPAEIETCEGQALNACQRLFASHVGVCYGICVIGCFYRVFTYEMTGSYWTSLTGDPDGAANLKNYADISNLNEAPLIDSLFRDIRQRMG